MARLLALFFLLFLCPLAYAEPINCMKGGFKITKGNPATIYHIDPDTLDVEVFMSNVPVDTTSFGYSSYYRAFYAVDKSEWKLKVIKKDSSGNPVVEDVDYDGTHDPGKIAMDVSPDGKTIYVRERGTRWNIVVIALDNETEAREVGNYTLENPEGYRDPGADLAIHPLNGHIYIFKDTKNGVYVYDENTGKLLKHYELDSPLDSEINAGSQWFDGQGRLYAWLNNTLSDGKYHLWRLTFNEATGKAVVEDFALEENVSGTGDGASCSVYGTKVSGHVFEDTTGDGLADGDANVEDSSGDQRAVSGAVVYLYDSEGRLAGSTRTDSRGRWFFYITKGGDYYVAVDSKTVSPSAGFNSDYSQGDVWAEQTYFKGASNGQNYAKGLCDTDADPSTAPQPKDEGACYGGAYGARSDDVTSLNSAEHKALLHVDTGDSLEDINFGFSFNVVVNTGDGDDDSSANRTVQGSLRQFVQNANAIAGANYMRFVPAVPKNESSWWKVVLTYADDQENFYALPPIEDDYTTVDGTAYDYRDGTTVVNANTSTVSAPGPVGTQEVNLEPFEGPELEVDANEKGSAFTIKASNVVVKKLSIFSTPYDSDKFPAGVFVDSGSGNKVEDLFIGVRADGSKPADEKRVAEGVLVKANARVDVVHSLIAHIEDAGITFMGEGVIEKNYIHHTGRVLGCGDAISFEFVLEGEYERDRDNVVVKDNYIDYSSAYGIESWMSPGAYTILNNTITRSGQGNDDGGLCESDRGGAEQGGIRLFGSGSLVKNNVIFNNPGSGVVVVSRGSDDPSVHNEITENSFYSNLLSIDLDQTHSPFDDNTNPNGDGVSPNDGVKDSNQQNEGLDYPVFTSATLSGSTLHVEGFVGTPDRKIEEVLKIEVYLADDDGNNDGEVFAGDGKSVPHGEGKKYLGSCNTFSNGTFSCDITVSGLRDGDDVTGIAIDSNGNTSEFSANYAVAPGTKITGYVYEDANHDTVRARDESGIGGVRVELWHYDGSSWVLESSTETDENGYFEFSPSSNGTYRVIEDYDDGGGNSPDSGSDPDGFVSTTPNVVELEWDGSKNRIVEFGDFHGGLLKGFVFDDSGNGSASSREANDAVFNDGERGIAGVKVDLCADADCGDVVSTTYTKGDGSYAFWIPYDRDGQELFVVESDPSGRTSTGCSVNSTVVADSRAPLKDRNLIAFNFRSGEVYEGYNFGDVGVIQITPPHSLVASPGDSVTVEHRINVATPGKVAILIASSQGWSYAVYEDADCDGEVDGDPVSPDSQGYYPLEGGAPLPAGDYCLILKTVVPTDASEGEVESLEVLVFEDWLNTSGVNGETGTLYDDRAEVEDAIRVSTGSAGALKLEKWVRNASNNEDFKKSNEAEPCDVLEYKIEFKNLSSGVLKSVVVSDVVPRGTEFYENYYNSGSADVKVVVEGDTYYGSIDDDPDSDGVTFDGVTLKVELDKLTQGKYAELRPGQEGYLLYRVKLEGDCSSGIIIIGPGDGTNFTF